MKENTNMSKELRDEVLALLIKQDKSGIAYCLNKARGVNSFGYSHYMEFRRSELIARCKNLTDSELTQLNSLTRFRDVFNKHKTA